MSFARRYFYDEFDGRSRWPRRFLDRNFGCALSPEDLLAASVGPSSLRNWWTEDANSSLRAEKDLYQVCVDVQNFTPEEISVTVVDGFVVVEGKHEEKRSEHGLVRRHFSRRFELPEECIVDKVESRLSSDGVLSVIAPKKKAAPEKGARSVPITPTGPVRKETEAKEEINIPVAQS